MAKGFFCCVLGWLQLFQLAFVDLLCDIAYACVICLSHTVCFGRNWVGVFILISSGWT